MPKIESQSAAASQLEGLHLYHANTSNCSARVRLLLEEKGLTWISHHIHLARRENITEEYFAINPQGVVPSLVRDGQVVTDSNDILVYLDEKFPEMTFQEVSTDGRKEIVRWLKLAADTHMPGIKTYQYHRLKAAGFKLSDEEADRYRQLQKDPKYLDFHGKTSGAGFTDADADGAQNVMNEVFAEMDDRLQSSDWLVENSYTLADISWAPTVTNLIAGEYDFTPYPHLTKWYERVSKRPAYERAVFAWRTRDSDDD